MRLERRRAARHPFIARADIVDEKENVRTTTRVSDLSLHGCYVEMVNPLPQGTNVLMEIYTETEFLETHATVVYLEPQRRDGADVHGDAGVFRERPEQMAGTSRRMKGRVKG